METSIAMQIIKKLITCILVLVILLFASNVAWLLAWTRYDFESIEITQETDDAENIAVVGNDNDVDVTPSSTKEVTKQVDVGKFGEEVELGSQDPDALNIINLE